MPLDEKKVFEYRELQKEIRRIVFELKSRFKTNYDPPHQKFFESLSAQGLGKIESSGDKNVFKLSKYGVIAVEEIMRVLIEESKKMSEIEFIE